MPPPSPPLKASPQRDALLIHFRAYLHLLITSAQSNQAKALKDLPGPGLESFCFALAKFPDTLLASELATPIRTILEQVSTLSAHCEATLRRQDDQSVALHDRCRRVLDQLDLALGLILRNFNTDLWFRGQATRDDDLLCALLVADTSSGGRITRMLRRYAQLHPSDPPEDSFMVNYALDVGQRVAELDRLADEFPDSIREAARQMPAWPMLVPRSSGKGRRFLELADRLELGLEYPLDTTKTARFRLDTPMVRLLEPLVHRLHNYWCFMNDYAPDHPDPENRRIVSAWWRWPEPVPGEEVIRILRATLALPPLTKATAAKWADTTIVPLLLATVVTDYRACTDPALKNIARQRGVKSPATFKSRLLAAVTATLRRLARKA